MALKCITISSSTAYNPLIRSFLSRARFMEEIGIAPSFKKAEQQAKSHSVAYIMLDLLACPAELAAYKRSDFPGARLVIFSKEDVFMLEPMPADLHQNLLSKEPLIVEGEAFDPGFRLRLGARDMTLELRSDETRVLLDHLPSQAPDSNDSLFVKSENRITRIDKKDISYVESQKDYIIFHADDREFRVLSRMKNISQRLGTQDFMRIHRSYLVRIDQIATIEQEQVFLKGMTKPLPVGPSYKNNLMESLQLV